MSSGSEQHRFVFAVPLKPRSASANWDLVQSNLRRAVRSAVQAASVARRPDLAVSVVIACHDEPELSQQSAADSTGEASANVTVDVVRVPFPEPDAPTAGGRDKAAKRRHIGSLLRQTPSAGTWVMFLDADDLVHRDLVRHVLTNGQPSYLVDQGYIFDAVARLLHRRRERFHFTCGSSFICRFDDDELPLSWNDVQAPFSQFGAAPDHRGHQEYDVVARELGRPAVKVPFPAVVYTVNHGESLWAARVGGTRRLRDPRDLVSSAEAKCLLADEFASSDLAVSLSDGAAVWRARLAATPGALRAGIRRKVAGTRQFARRG